MASVSSFPNSNVTLLAQLKDVHLPKPLGWWPPAFGFIFLFVVAILILGGLGFLWWQRFKYGREKRAGLEMLAAYKLHYLRAQNSQEGSAFVSELLKRIALVYYPRAQVAGLNGEAWIVFLNDSAKGLDFHSVSDALLRYPYQPAHQAHLDELFRLAEAWIKQRGKPCLN